MRNTLNILIFVLLTINTMSAQESVDIFGINFIHNPKVGLKNPMTPELENLDLNVTELDAFIRFPIQLKNEKTVLVNTLKWHFVKAPFDDLPNDRSFEANLHSIQYDFSIRHKLSDSWLTLVRLRPTLASNFKEPINGDDFFFQGMAAIKYLANDNMSYGGGVSYSNGFGEPKTIPILMLDYKTDHIKTSILAPISASFKYQTKNVSYGVDAKLEGGQYHLGNDDNGGPVITNNETVKFSRYNIGPVLDWNFDEHSRFEISAGISLKRTLKVIDNSGVEADYDLKNGLFFKTAYYFGK